MKNINSYLVGIIISILALIPPIYFSIDAPSEYWPWWILISGLLGFYTLFIKTDSIVKIVAVGGFINCFLSAAPFISFSSYISLVVCCYFYILCRSIKDYEKIFKILQCLLLFVVFMFVMQGLGFDNLLNHGRDQAFNRTFGFGAIGHYMQSGSFSVILAAALLPFTVSNLGFPLIISFIANSPGTFLCFLVGFISYTTENKYKLYGFKVFGILFTIFIAWMIMSGKVSENIASGNGRLAVWSSTLRMSLKHPWAGWGMSTYKGLFPALGGIFSIAWKQAHNCWIQIIFEFGYIAFAVIAGYFIYLFGGLWRLARRHILREESYKCMAGLSMIIVDMMIHFPTRMIQTILIIIFFLAYCQGVINHGRIKTKSC